MAYSFPLLHPLGLVLLPALPASIILKPNQMCQKRGQKALTQLAVRHALSDFKDNPSLPEKSYLPAMFYRLGISFKKKLFFNYFISL